MPNLLCHEDIMWAFNRITEMIISTEKCQIYTKSKFYESMKSTLLLVIPPE